MCLHQEAFEQEGHYLLGYNAVQFGRSSPTFQWNILTLFEAENKQK
jgi:hypothetical protein